MADRCLLYYITDRWQFHGDEHARRCALVAKIAEAAASGIDYIQLREKDLSSRDLELLAREIVGILLTHASKIGGRDLKSRLLINSRTDIALAVGADGVHLRFEDVAPREVRRVLQVSADRSGIPDKFLIAASCHTATEVAKAEEEEVDFAVFAPVFGKSGTRAEPAGLESLREACRGKIPVLALGGVTLKNAASCLDAGAAGVAAIRLFQENKIEDVVRVLRTL